MVDLYYWFDYSTKRKNKLAEYANFCDQEYRQIVKHVSMRWLSLEKSVTRTLTQYASLRSYFLSEQESSARFKRSKDAFSDPSTGLPALLSGIPADLPATQLVPRKGGSTDWFNESGNDTIFTPAGLQVYCPSHC